MKYLQLYVLTLVIVIFSTPNAEARKMVQGLTESAACVNGGCEEIKHKKPCDGYPDSSKYSCNELEKIYWILANKKDKAEALANKVYISDYEFSQFNLSELSQDCRDKAIYLEKNYGENQSLYKDKIKLFQFSSWGPFNDWHEAMYSKNISELNKVIEEAENNIAFNNKCTGSQDIFNYLAGLTEYALSESSIYKPQKNVSSCDPLSSTMSGFSCQDMFDIHQMLNIMLDTISDKISLYRVDIKKIEGNTEKKGGGRKCNSELGKGYRTVQTLNADLRKIQPQVDKFKRVSRHFDSSGDKKYSQKVYDIANKLESMAADIEQQIECSIPNSNTASSENSEAELSLSLSIGDELYFSNIDAISHKTCIGQFELDIKKCSLLVSETVGKNPDYNLVVISRLIDRGSSQRRITDLLNIPLKAEYSQASSGGLSYNCKVNMKLNDTVFAQIKYYESDREWVGVSGNAYQVRENTGKIATAPSFFTRAIECLIPNSNAAPSENIDWDLYMAIGDNDFILAKSLIKQGADVNAYHGENKQTPLFVAVMKSEELTELLLMNGADVNARSKTNETPLIRAASTGHSRELKLLLDHGADVSHEDDYGRSALELAKNKIHYEIYNYMIEKSKN